ncbi:MAG TPA: hypothetical protein VFQ39_11535, partial [Longimicrobium sp.]|nr:hypothetical protein [Longimicrobium sp.]
MSSTIAPQEADQIALAEAFPMDSILRRYISEHGLTWESAKEHERELKRYLVLCATRPEAGYGMMGPVDELWHTFIIFTREYAQFCDVVAGRFIHHVPRDPSDESGTIAAGYQKFLEDYAEMFGEEAPPHLWPRLHQGATSGGDCSFG